MFIPATFHKVLLKKWVQVCQLYDNQYRKKAVAKHNRLENNVNIANYQNFISRETLVGKIHQKLVSIVAL